MRRRLLRVLPVAERILVLGLLSCGEATRPDLRSLSVFPDSVVVSLRDSIRVASRLLSENGDSLPIAPSAWIVFDTSVATATPAGVVRGLKVGGTTLAVASEGVVRTVPVAVVTRFRAVVVGVFDAYALADDSLAYSWGDTAKAVPGARRFAIVSAGRSFACGLTGAGTAYCWGGYGPLGNGQGYSDVPVPVASAMRFRALSVGQDFACAVTTQGEVWCWGTSIWGVTGPNGQYTTPYPVHVPFPDGVIVEEVSAGGYHACALSTMRTAWCWGYARYGQLGVDPAALRGPCTHACSPTPVAVTGGLSFASLASGTSHTCGIATTGNAYCWGDNYEGELGDTLRSACSYNGTPCSWAPIPTRSTTPLVSLTAGSYYTCGLTAAGAASCWGSNTFGVFGDGTEEWSSVPVPGALGGPWESLSAGYDHTCGRSTGGVVYCWGRGALGAGASHASPVPKRVWFQQ